VGETRQPQATRAPLKGNAMKRLLPSTVPILVLFGSIALAGSTKILKTTPEDGSVSDSPPSAFVLEFSDAVSLHQAYLKKDNERQKALHVATPSSAKTVTIPAPSLTAGHYTLEWSAFADQSRVLSGRIRFTVSAPATTAAAAPTH
jgi:methionine-rich copper-binding protein CopC